VRLGGSALVWEPTSERLIAIVRLGLAAAALIVVWIDPTRPIRYVPVAYAAFVSYLLYSMGVYWLARRGAYPRLPLVTQIIDLLWVPPVLYFTEAANSPFFVFFVVFTFTAAIRWGLWISWMVTLYSLAAYTSLLLVTIPVRVDLNEYLMRPAYLLIFGVLGGFLVEHWRRREAELRLLSTISAAIATKGNVTGAVAEFLDLAHQHRLADGALALLREPESGEIVMVRGRKDTRRLGPEEAAPLLGALGGGQGTTGPPLISLSGADAMVLRFAGAEEGLAYPIRLGDEVAGALVFLYDTPAGRRDSSTPFLALLLSHVVPQLEALYLLEHARAARVLEERRRIARDLHDSFIQVLAALGFRLRALDASLRGDGEAGRSPDVAKELAELTEIIRDELHRVRAYIAEMREPADGAVNLADAIRNTTAAFRSRTRLTVDLSVGPGLDRIPADIVRELTPLLREALTNVEKHAAATSVAVSAHLRPEGLRLAVTDDGVGIDRARALSAGPGTGHGLDSMRERASLLGGTLVIEPAVPRGTRLEVSIPIATSA
jgi:signal transduction histidine kinase